MVKKIDYYVVKDIARMFDVSIARARIMIMKEKQFGDYSQVGYGKQIRVSRIIADKKHDEMMRILKPTEEE